MTEATPRTGPGRRGTDSASSSILTAAELRRTLLPDYRIGPGREDVLQEASVGRMALIGRFDGQSLRRGCDRIRQTDDSKTCAASHAAAAAGRSDQGAGSTHWCGQASRGGSSPTG